MSKHLGGHNNKTWHDSGALEYLKNEVKAETMLDIGCGPGGQIRAAQKLGLKVQGVDGDPTFKDHPDIYIHDYAVGPLKTKHIPNLPRKGYFDIGWSVEFLEHVDAEYIDNYMATFAACKYMVVTHARPGQGGYHHVNEQHFNYWRDVFEKNDFKVSGILTQGIRANSTMRLKKGLGGFNYIFKGDNVIVKKINDTFLNRNGWVFVNQRFI